MKPANLRHLVYELSDDGKTYAFVEAFDTLRQALDFIASRHKTDKKPKLYMTSTKEIHKTWNG